MRRLTLTSIHPTNRLALGGQVNHNQSSLGDRHLESTIRQPIDR